VVIDFARDGKLPDATDSVPSGTVPSDSVAGIPVEALTEPTLTRIVHRLRKVMVALLVGRTSVLKYAKEQKVQAHDDGVRMLANVTEYLKSLVPAESANHGDCPHDSSEAKIGGTVPCDSHCPDKDKNSAALWTAPLL